MRKMLPLVCLVFLLLTSGCQRPFQGRTTAPEATMDPVSLRTEAAQTIVAKITFEAVQTKVALPTEAMQTSSPTEQNLQATLTKTLPIKTLPPTATQPTQPVSPTIKTIYPTFTPTYYTDKANLDAQTPVDGTYFSPGADFDLVFSLTNLGARAWNNSFYLKLLSGVQGTTQGGQAITLVFIPHPVAPGEIVHITIDMIAPQQPGGYASNWALINDDGTAFYWPNLVFNVQ